MTCRGNVLGKGIGSDQRIARYRPKDKQARDCRVEGEGVARSPSLRNKMHDDSRIIAKTNSARIRTPSRRWGTIHLRPWKILALPCRTILTWDIESELAAA